MAGNKNGRSWARSGIVSTLAVLVAAGSSPALAAGSAPGGTPVQDVSRACLGPNAEVETATAAPNFVYDRWIGCNGIGFARSADGGRRSGTTGATATSSPSAHVRQG
jgi:hypothetical protein